MYYVFQFIHAKDYNYFAFMMVLTWGILDSSVNTGVQALLGREFNKSPHAYGMLYICQSFFVVIFETISITVVTFDDFFILSSCIAIMGCAFFSLNFLVVDNKVEEKE